MRDKRKSQSKKMREMVNSRRCQLARVLGFNGQPYAVVCKQELKRKGRKHDAQFRRSLRDVREAMAKGNRAACQSWVAKSFRNEFLNAASRE